MDKALFRAYVKELVKEQIEESVEKAVKKILPEVLGEAVKEIKSLQESTTVKPTAKPKLDRAKLAEMMGLERLGDTIVATTQNMQIPSNVRSDDPAVQAINKDYSELMKKMGLSK
jgi:Na+-translocating ferredoxin:NAD+ oxidoreductase RnfG subunit